MRVLLVVLISRFYSIRLIYTRWKRIVLYFCVSFHHLAPISNPFTFYHRNSIRFLEVFSVFNVEYNYSRYEKFNVHNFREFSPLVGNKEDR